MGPTATTYSDWVGPTDTDDYYRFTLTETANFSLTLTGLSQDANVQLLGGSGTVIQQSTNPGNASETITRQLTAGTYYIRVLASGGSSTLYNLNVSAVRASGDWFSQNLRDAGLITITRELARDGILSRNDMISIFRNAQDDNVIDANELNDLRTIVANATRFNMPDHVRVLSNKVVNGDPANATFNIWTVTGDTLTFGGTVTLGNLFAGASATHMERLIGKWFLGQDRPLLEPVGGTRPVYRRVNGALFQNGISAGDVDQGSLQDCYYLATLASIAHEQPSRIQSMFIDNGDGTFTVRFFNNGVADYVTVDRYLPTTSNRAAYAGWGGGEASSSMNELWVALAEKAYAQLGASGWSRPGNNRNSYSDIEGGWMDYVIRQVTGLGAEERSISPMTQSQLIDLVNSNRVLTIGFLGIGREGPVSINGQTVVDLHAYTITSYNGTTGRFFLRNPWGHSHAELTFAELQSLAARPGAAVRLIYSV